MAGKGTGSTAKKTPPSGTQKPTGDAPVGDAPAADITAGVCGVVVSLRADEEVLSFREYEDVVVVVTTAGRKLEVAKAAA